jgi:Zn-dependent protease
MLLGAPEETPYDLRFRLVDIPVRVHPLFWVVMLVIGFEQRNPTATLIFVAAAFVSILVHEFGHALSSRYLGHEPDGIVLYAMGGFCYSVSGYQLPWKRLIILACGPGAGFVLMGLVLAFGRSYYGIAPIDAIAITGLGFGYGNPVNVLLRIRHEAAYYLFLDLVWINLMWGIFNLFPIWPLDGGQMTGVALSMVNRREGARWGHAISLVTAAGLALWRLSKGELISALWIGYFAMINYQILQEMQRHFWAAADADWWRR